MRFIEHNCEPILRKIRPGEGRRCKRLDRWTKKILRMKVHARQFQRAATNVAAMVFTSYLMTYMSSEPHSL